MIQQKHCLRLAMTVIGVLTFTLTGCNSVVVPPVTVATPLPLVPIATPLPPSPTLQPTFTPEPPPSPTTRVVTPTPRPATATPLPPTATIPATPTIPPTPEPGKPLPFLAANIASFTGQSVQDSHLLDRIPLIVKINNAPAARPQSGLSFADVVVEHLAEGGVTRFDAIFHSQGATRVGSVRSARLLDLELPVIFQSMFAYSGANHDVNQMLWTSDFSKRVIVDDGSNTTFFRVPQAGKAYEHTLFTSTQNLWDIAKSRSLEGRPHPLWPFADLPPDGGTKGTTISITYNDYNKVKYEYDSSRQLFNRWADGAKHLDAWSGEQLTARNVVVLFVNHVETLIVEDVLGSKSIQIQLWGTGRALLFRNGQMFEARWTRKNRLDPLRITDGAGRLIPFKSGNTWIEMVPLALPVGFN
ncbi:MAG: DUF3048 domain-containing protein [Chloroflexi bacterium]|nr:DUF3048 domain-containing protein [Chloroflexota bacterium]